LNECSTPYNILPPDVQEQLAEQIEDFIGLAEEGNEYFGGSMPDIPDDAEESILRMRDEVPPSKPVDLGDGW
jgi:hypothetical protein